jgi:hypothetical protein
VTDVSWFSREVGDPRYGALSLGRNCDRGFVSGISGR